MVYMTEKKDTSVKILKPAKQLLDEVVVDRGIGKIELISRIVEWFASQSKTLQAIILGQIDPVDETEVLSMIKTRLHIKAETEKANQAVDLALNDIKGPAKRLKKRKQSKPA